MKILSNRIIIFLLLGAASVLNLSDARAWNDVASLEELGNATYKGVENTPLTLSDGYWEGSPYMEGGASRPRAGLLKEMRFNGDLDGDAHPETVVIIWHSAGGTGSHTHLAVMKRQRCTVENIATALIGDRVKLRGGRIESGKVILEVLQSGEQDAMCCPSVLATRTWWLQEGQLEEGEVEVTGKLELAALTGSGWTLTHLNTDEPVPAGAEVTLKFDVERVSGKSACNRYSAGIKDGANAGDLDIGPTASTRMACPDQLMEVEHQYLEALTHVESFSFHAGQLALSGQNEDATRFTMLFDPKEK